MKSDENIKKDNFYKNLIKIIKKNKINLLKKIKEFSFSISSSIWKKLV